MYADNQGTKDIQIFVHNLALLVENIQNNADNADILIDGYEVDSCQNGLEALELCEVQYYDLILLDFNLPEMDGMEVLRRLREEDGETPVLILSARGQIWDKVEELDAEANDYLTKPFHFEELEARVRSLTRRKFIKKDVCLQCGEISFDTKARTGKTYILDSEHCRYGYRHPSQRRFYILFSRTCLSSIANIQFLYGETPDGELIRAVGDSQDRR